MIFLGLLLVLAQLVSAEITVLKSNQIIYDKSPKLRIRGTGFDAQDHDITLELAANGSPNLLVDKDYVITKDTDGDGLILKLLGNRRWVDMDDRTPPVAMVLSAVRFASDPKKNLLRDPVIIAQVLNTPSVKESSDVIYQSATNELRINGTGFLGAKKVDFYFKPPLVKEVAYEDVTPYPLARDQIVLRLRHGYKWREEPGPLAIIGVDTGGGAVKQDSDEGVKVAEVQENLDFHGVTVDPTASTQLLYADDANLIISGSGFNPVGNTLRFANGILGQGVNFTTVISSETSITLRLVPGSYWRKNFENLPAPLTLLAVNAGQGFVAVGPTNSGKGRDIAMIFERPQVFSSNKKLYRTHSHELHISGTGFPEPPSPFKPKLKFSPPLVEGTDYTLRVVERKDLEITLLDGRAWRSDPGALMVTQINVRGDDGGWISLPGAGIHVAEVVEDVDAVQTGGVEVIPMGVKVYQSALQETIPITGTGFKDGMAFTFDPPIKAGTDYELTVQSKNKAVLKLKSGKKWRPDAGFIVAKAIKIDGKDYSLAGSEGIRVAVVLADPVITASTDNYHESQSKLVVISGSGFTTAQDTKITLRPTSAGAFKILGVLDDAIRLQLKPDQAWLPSFMSLKGEDESKKTLLQVASIDCGAGEIVFDEPITIGTIVKDREGVVCDDSCEFAFDGICDDGSEPNDQYYYENYGYQDDDLGGFYGEPEDTDGDGKTYGGVAYDDYYMPNEDYQVSPCVEGTDCTDCGGVDAVIDYSKPLDPDSGYVSCTNTCIYPRDGVCDDPRGTKYCELGTDCQDCGPVGADNFTRADDDGWWDDDDDYWTFNDGNFIDQTKGLEYNRHHVKKVNRQDSAGPAAMFLVVLEGMVYTVGAIFAAAALYLLNRWYKGQSVPFMNVFNPEENMSARDFEMRPTQRMPITPDEFRT
jgi:hypothetical protein